MGEVQVPGDAVRRTEEKWDRWKSREVSAEERIEKRRERLRKAAEEY